MTLRISSSRPMTGSSLPFRAASVRSRPYFSRAWYCSSGLSLVTRWVVLPVRHAAAAAQRVSAGHLGERMQVHGVDDLAALATSFNDMAASLQGKLRELVDLSNVQRQFVSDVSHELRTPLSTIKMADDLLFVARAELDAAAGRSVELLQSQL